MPYMMRPQSEDMQATSIVNEYKDPMQRVVVQKDTIDQVVDVR